MSDAELKAFVDEAPPELVSLWFALVRLFDALEVVPQPTREAALEAVLAVVERDDLSVWEEAVEHWG